MGNKQSYENGKKLLSVNETEYGVLLHVVDMNHNHNEHLKFVETKYSKVGTFTYFKLSNNLSKIINNGVSFNITIYKTCFTVFFGIEKYYFLSNKITIYKFSIF